uniref:ETS variant transcription factor 5a n=1 Tax=Gasterosteus aculeatus aculeatus TaxID=481459 RepID=A0AAQ4NU07_GASAC
MDGFYDQQVPFMVPPSQQESRAEEPSHHRPPSDRKRKFVDTELAQDTEELVRFPHVLRFLFVFAAQVPDDEQFVPDFQSDSLMFHGPPPAKIKRELTPSKEFSPCRQDRSLTPYGEKCLYSYSACDRKPTPGFKPLTPPSTPVSPCGPASTAGTRPLGGQAPPPRPHAANHTPGPRPLRVQQQQQQQQQPIAASAGSPEQQAHPLHSPPFAVPCAPVSQDANSFSQEHRFQRQMQGRPHFLPRPPSSLPRDGRPPYHRQMSEPCVAAPPQGFKQELVDPRYAEQGVPSMGPPGPRRPAAAAAAFHAMAIKPEPRDFCFDSEVPNCQSLFGRAGSFYQNNHDSFSFDRDAQLYFDDTCVVPERLDGKVKQEPSVYRDGPPYQRRGSLQLWQFLVTLLDDPANGHFIAWTGRGMEFKLIEPEEVSTCPLFPFSPPTDPPTGGSVAGERYVYKFVCDPEALFSMAFPDNQRPNLKVEPDSLPGLDDDTVPLTHYEETPPYLLDAGEQCGAGLPFPDGYGY